MKYFGSPHIFFLSDFENNREFDIAHRVKLEKI